MSEKSSSLERDPKYDEKIAKARRFRSELLGRGYSEEEANNEAKEKAQRLRMELMLDNASCAQAIIEFLETNPGATKSDFIEFTKQTGLVVHPEVVERFVTTLVKTKAYVNDFLEWLQLDGEFGKMGATTVVSSQDKNEGQETSISRDAARQLYQIIARTDSAFPEGEVSVGNDFPLAVEMFVEQESDFKRIDSRTNIGGFYKHEQEKISDDGWDIDYTFPLIVVKSSSDWREKILKHERGHSVNRNFAEALKKAKRKAVWGNYIKSPFRDSKKTDAMLELLEVTPDPETNRDFQYILKYALARAKDELLADFMATGGWDHLQSLLKQDGLYNYFKALETAHPGLYNLFWDRYGSILKEAVDAVSIYANTYLYLGLEKRRKNFAFVLAQVPLQEWSKQLLNSGFRRELMILDDFYSMYETWKYDPGTEGLRDNFDEEADEIGNRPLFDLVDKYLAKSMEQY